MKLILGKTKRRLGVVGETWHKTPESRHYSQALPENTEMEIVRCFGLLINNCFIGIQVFVDKNVRIEQGFQFGPEPNVLDLIKDA